MTIRRWPPVAGLSGGARYFARAAWMGVTNFLAIAGIVAVVFGLLYRFAAGHVPRLLQAHRALLAAHGAAGPDSHRATVLLATGAISILVAWLIRPRRRP